MARQMLSPARRTLAIGKTLVGHKIAIGNTLICGRQDGRFAVKVVVLQDEKCLKALGVGRPPLKLMIDRNNYCAFSARNGNGFGHKTGRFDTPA
jgi:hypothetical protein